MIVKEKPVVVVTGASAGVGRGWRSTLRGMDGLLH